MRIVQIAGCGFSVEMTIIAGSAVVRLHVKIVDVVRFAAPVALCFGNL